MYSRAVPDANRFRDSRINARARAISSPIANDTTAIGIVLAIAPCTMGHSAEPNRSQREGSAVIAGRLRHAGRAASYRETSCPKYFLEMAASVPSSVSFLSASSTAWARVVLPLVNAKALVDFSAVSAAIFSPVSAFCFW